MGDRDKIYWNSYEWTAGFNRAFAEAGLDWNWSIELYGRLLAVSGGKERIRFYLQQYCPDFQQGWGEEDIDGLIADLHGAKNKYYQQLLASGSIPLRPGVRRLLTEAKTKALVVAIATTSALPNATELLEHTLDPSWFEVIAAGDIVPAKKPAPDIYEYVLASMGLAASECLVFEDSQHGLQAASQSGLKTVVTVNDSTKYQDFADAILLLNHLGEPEQPFTVIAWEVQDLCYFDMAMARILLG